ncbi:MAG: 5'-nucleotidase C-terminal domain-containing protein, partial [Verrucomicrobiae bacterium]|nr:5'-nucleotidase C-terminal domain-containing protein [Verrucomicrobiae bacterium]
MSQLDIENTLRFNNGLTLLTVTAAELLQILEHGVAATAPGQTPGQFPQVGGVRFSFDPDLPPGSRVLSASIMDWDGTTLDVLKQDGVLLGEFGEERRAFVPIAQVPDIMKKAILSIEDERFYQHGGCLLYT